MKNQLTIIGAGIAGLSAGIYAQKRGFQCAIYEQYYLPGGNCTSWKRKGYTFEGGLHWLTGSKNDTPLYKEWNYLGAISPSTTIHNREAFISCIFDQQIISFYTNPERLRDRLLEISPVDEKAIRELYKQIRRFSGMVMPIFDAPGVKLKERSSKLYLWKMLFLALQLSPFGKISAEEYAKRFKHPATRLMVQEVAGAENKASHMLTLLASACSGDGGYPEGGSIEMAKRMATYFEKLGGKIHYSNTVEKIHLEGNKVTAITVNGKPVNVAQLIIANDAREAIDTLFETPLNEPWCHRMRQDTKPVICTFVSVGLKKDWSRLPTNFLIPLTESLSFGDFTYKSLFLNNYASYPDYAPSGCTALTCILFGNSYDYWKKAKDNGSYSEKKKELAEKFAHMLTNHFQLSRDEIEIIDIATPLTFERYCGTYRGSWMTIDEVGKKAAIYPIKSETISNLYFAGQRIMSPGGTPVALLTGRQAVQYLCKDNNMSF
ncbi:MAG TPA: NAD(P)/FAD-dependent oxidoreductase [Spirochaetota bacterium]|nr:NAD(P)/FAD-dependent oxidoreductase [Spirochaetota bacterium]HOS32301.1 NAD(P)/FAD-dependent oxidoreductase [Spirochaetota bacterium]HOS54685.1 NAD(P)/FAD-dependent oxidoreductase [Spirochaetota bacterium]HQF77295.1 NAD(P)/FAD-dependent oxidoreductase [Spirochaetota bacterium]HQH29371.1 NAD(P)/FAD-dependent oxidoreductase [Spirochaetota bacterium]